MLNLIAAALVAAAPVPPAPPADAHAQHEAMGDMKPGMPAQMKDDCCCKDMMAKMHQGHGEEQGGHKGR